MSTPLLTDIANVAKISPEHMGALRVDEDYSPVAPAANKTSHTVWLQQDTATRQAQSQPLESHWSRQITQPLVPPPLWPIQPHAARRAAIIARPKSRILGPGVGCGAVVAFLALSLLLLVALNSHLLYGRASAAPEMPPRPTSVQPSPTHPPHVPTRSVGSQPHSNANQPIPTVVPTSPPTATAQPTPMATPSPIPTATPAPTLTPTPQPMPTSTPAPEPTPTGEDSTPTPAPSPPQSP